VWYPGGTLWTRFAALLGGRFAFALAFAFLATLLVPRAFRPRIAIRADLLLEPSPAQALGQSVFETESPRRHPKAWNSGENASAKEPES
jgi:hypothetical protein